MAWTRIARTGGVAALGAALGALVAGAALAETSGTVLSAHGAAHAHGADGRRSLDCGDVVREGERVVTGADGHAALSVGELYVQVGPASGLRLGPEGRLLVQQGLVRAVDLGEEGAPAELRTPHAWLQGAGFDAEILVDDGRSELCEGLGTPEVGRTAASGRTRIEPGRCAIADAGDLRVAPRGEERLALSGAEGCVDVDVASHFQPADVAAPPPALDLFPLDPDKRTFHPCDDPGSGCGGMPQVRVQATPVPTPPQPPPDFGFGTGPAEPPGLGFGTGPAESGVRIE